MRSWGMTMSKQCLSILAGAALGSVLFTACTTTPSAPSASTALRPHDQRHFVVAEAQLPFTALAEVAGVGVPLAASLLRIAQTLLGVDLAASGRTAERMGIAGLDRNGLLKRVGARPHGG